MRKPIIYLSYEIAKLTLWPHCPQITKRSLNNFALFCSYLTPTPHSLSVPWAGEAKRITWPRELAVELYQKCVRWGYYKNKWNDCKPYTTAARRTCACMLLLPRNMAALNKRIRARTKKNVFPPKEITALYGLACLKITWEEDRFCLKCSHGKTNRILPQWN